MGVSLEDAPALGMHVALPRTTWRLSREDKRAWTAERTGECFALVRSNFRSMRRIRFRSFARETTNHTHEIKLHCAPLQYPRTKTFRCRVQQSQRPALATRWLRCKSKVHAVFTRYVPLRCIGHSEITPSVKGMCTSRRSCGSGRGCALEFGDRMLHDCAREDEWKCHGGWDRDRGWYLKRMQVR